VDEPRERWFSALTTKELQRSAHRNVKEVAADINAWAATWNENQPLSSGTRPPTTSSKQLAGYCTAINQGTDT
jgi:hypothetical protein